MITDTIKTDMVSAMKAKDAEKVQTLRSVMAAFTNELVALKRKPTEELSDEEALAVIKRAAKQREDSIEQYTKGGRTDLADTEAEELAVLKEYLPEMMSREAIEPIAKAKMDELGVSDKSGMGKLVGAIMAELKGRAEGSDVKTVVERLLS